MAKLSKMALIKVKDFEPALFGSITFNGITHSTLAEFYDIPEKEKKTLFYIQNKLDSLHCTQKQNISSFLNNLLKIHNDIQELKNSKDFSITSNGSVFLVHYKCNLKKSYQTDNQLASSH